MGARRNLKRFVGRRLARLSEWGGFRAQRLLHGGFFDYQPLPWLGLRSSKRQESTLRRWEAMEAALGSEATTGSALDIGCNVGHFVLRLAEKGYFAIGVDVQDGCTTIARYAQKRGGIANAAFATARITPDNVRSLPRIDVLVFCSVWHHWIRHFGHATASEMLGVIWEKTARVLFFESGEDTEIELLGIEGDPAVWVRSELERICTGAAVEELGRFDRGNHKKTRLDRTLFAVRRTRTAAQEAHA